MPNIHSELDLEKYIRENILASIGDTPPGLRVLENKKAVDILIARDSNPPCLFMIEVKLHQAKHGRLGIGGGKGKGFQPEIINGNFPYFEKHLRWILGHKERKGEFWFVDTETIRNHLSGGKVAAKFNNIQKSVFEEVKSVDAEGLKNSISTWLKS